MGFGANAELNLSLEASHRVIRLAARQLSRAWQQQGGNQVRAVRPTESPSGARVVLGLGSLVVPSVLVRFELPYEREAGALAEELALTTVAWDTLGDFEPWRALSAPLQGLPCLGRPDPSRAWALALGGRQRLRAPPDDGVQLHVIGGWVPPARDAVWWPPAARVIAAVLGRADCVLGQADPLVYDAIRAGVPVRERLVSNESDARGFDGVLAGLVPPSLLRDERVWQHVVDTARHVHQSGEAPAPLMSREWVAWGRESIRQRSASPPNGRAWMRRRYEKLLRDPERFFADSRFGALRAFGRLRYGRTLPLDQRETPDPFSTGGEDEKADRG